MNERRSEEPDEIVAFGPKRSLLRSRWLLVAAALVAVVLIVRLDQRAPSSQVTPPPSPTSPPLSTTQPTTERIATGSPRVTEAGHRLLGVTGDWELFARGPGEVIRIQVALGRITRTPVPALQSSAPVSLTAGAGGVVVRPLDFVPGYLVPDGGPTRPLADGLSKVARSSRGRRAIRCGRRTAALSCWSRWTDPRSGLRFGFQRPLRGNSCRMGRAT